MSLVCCDIPFLQKIFRNYLNSSFHLTFSGLDAQLSIEWWLVRGRNSCKFSTRRYQDNEYNYPVSVPFISPSLALLYSPFGSRSSATSRGTSTKTSIKFKPASS